MQVNGIILFKRHLGHGFFTLKTDHVDTIRAFLLLTSYCTLVGIYIFQRWSVGFDPNLNREFRAIAGASGSMKIHIWVTLYNIPDEFYGIAHQIAVGIGEVLGTDTGASGLADPRFYPGLDSRSGWESLVSVTNLATQITSVILIDYTFLPIRCRYCFNTIHYVKDCLIRLDHCKPQILACPPIL